MTRRSTLVLSLLVLTAFSAPARSAPAAPTTVDGSDTTGLSPGDSRDHPRPATDAAGGGSANRAAAPQRPPVILISLDTLRADHVGAYGHTRATTPRLDAFAEDAVLFENAFTTGGGTLPAHMTLLTSLPPGVHGVTAESGTKLDPAIPTLAQILGGAGYRTAGFTGAGYVQRHWGFGRGFEHFDDAGRGFEQILPKALAWLDEEDGRPPFLFLHTLDIHSDWDRLPYDAPPPFRDRFVTAAPDSFDGCRDDLCASKLLAHLNQQTRRGAVDLGEYFRPDEIRYLTELYDGGVAHADARFGDLLDALKERGLYDEAVLVVVSDHGEEFLEHGMLLHEQIYDEIVRVPLLVKLPRGRRGGTRIAGLASLADVAPTVVAAAGANPPITFTGYDLARAPTGGDTDRDAVHIWGVPEKIRTAQWSLVVPPDQEAELYAIGPDPGERRNVAAEYPDVVRTLRARLDTFAHADAATRGRSPTGDETAVELTPELVRQLEALGYLQD